MYNKNSLDSDPIKEKLTGRKIKIAPTKEETPFLVQQVLRDGGRRIISRHKTRTGASVSYVIMEDINPQAKFEIKDERQDNAPINYVI